MGHPLGQPIPRQRETAPLPGLGSPIQADTPLLRTADPMRETSLSKSGPSPLTGENSTPQRMLSPTPAELFRPKSASAPTKRVSHARQPQSALIVQTDRKPHSTVRFRPIPPSKPHFYRQIHALKGISSPLWQPNRNLVTASRRRKSVHYFPTLWPDLAPFKQTNPTKAVESSLLSDNHPHFSVPPKALRYPLAVENQSGDVGMFPLHGAIPSDSVKRGPLYQINSAFLGRSSPTFAVPSNPRDAPSRRKISLVMWGCPHSMAQFPPIPPTETHFTG